MSEETVIIGCRLPNGLILEVGLQTTAVVDGKQVGKSSAGQLPENRVERLECPQ